MNTLEHTNPSFETKNTSSSKSHFFQPKLTINNPGDSYEQEANAMADKVMRMKNAEKTDGFFSPAISTIQRKCVACEEEQVHRKESSGSEVHGGNDFNNYISSLHSSGQQLPESVRQFFEPRFGQDFSNVKVHTDSVAAKSAQSINALAYTTGNNIVFNQEQYSPDSESGQRLMAHELTHVIQQKSADTSMIQRMVPCPGHLNDTDPIPAGWRLYPGPTSVFHCGFRTILENRTPTPDDPMNECVYDHSGTLVDKNHDYSGCRGTPDQYDSRTDPIKHALIDSGGILRNLGSFFTSRSYDMKDMPAWGSSPTFPYPDGTWYDSTGKMHMGAGPKI